MELKKKEKENRARALSERGKGEGRWMRRLGLRKLRRRGGVCWGGRWWKCEGGILLRWKKEVGLLWRECLVSVEENGNGVSRFGLESEWSPWRVEKRERADWNWNQWWMDGGTVKWLSVAAPNYLFPLLHSFSTLRQKIKNIIVCKNDSV